MASVINNQDFRTSYTTSCNEIKNQTARGAVNVVGALGLLPLLKPSVEHVDSFLNNLRTDARFTIGGGAATFTALQIRGNKKADYNVIKDCFKDTQRHKLVGFFASTIAPFIAFWIMARAQRLAIGAAAPNYAIDATVINAYRALGPTIMTKSAVEKRTRFFENNMELMCLRLCADWDDINELFFPNLVLKKLIRLATTGSDYHKEGKQVLILTFKAHPPAVVTRRGISVFSMNVVTIAARQEVKLVYKPSDVELDWRMVGDTNEINARVPHLLAGGAGLNQLTNANSLFVSLNNGLAAHPIAARPPLQLPVYKILPRSPGTNLVPNPMGGALPVQDSYGYIEFLTYLPECNLEFHQDDTVAPPMRYWTSDLNGTPPHTWDFITLDPAVPAHQYPPGMNPTNELQSFYRIFGWYMALGLILNFGDQHTENLYVRNRQPYLIDLEIMFKHRANELAATMLDYHFRIASLNPNDEKNVLLSQNVMVDRLLLTMGSQAAGHMVAGFNEAMTWIENHPQPIRNWLNEPGMPNVFTRYTPRKTNDYTMNMWNVFMKNSERNVPTPATYNTAPFTTLKNWDYYKWFTHNTYGMDGRPVFALSDPDHDWACYLNCDAPAYSRRLGSLDLLNARGMPVWVVDPGAPAALNISLNEPDGPFSVPPKAELVLPIPVLAPPGNESIILSAKAGGNAGKNISIELLANNSGIVNQVITGIVIALLGGIHEITITFATNGLGANDPPPMHVLKFLIDHTPAITHLIDAQIQPNGAPGNTPLPAQARTSLGPRYPNTTRTIPALNHLFFQFDIDGVNPVLTPLQISLARLHAIEHGTTAGLIEGNVTPGKSGTPLLNAITLQDVINEFRASTIAALPNNSAVNF